MLYADVGQLMRFLRIPEDDSVDDVDLELALASASAEIDFHCRRTFAPADASPVTRYYAARWDRQLIRTVVDIDDLMTTTGLAVALDAADDQTWPTSVDVADVRTWPVNAAPAAPWTRLILPIGAYAGSGYVRVTGKFGWTSVPDVVVNATLLQASRNFKRRDAPFGVAGSPDMGNELRLLAKLDPDVCVMLRGVRRWWGAR